MTTLHYTPELPSQTAGPYVHIGLIPAQAGLDIFSGQLGGAMVTEATLGERIRIEGRVLDGLGAPCRDVLLEIWQANAAGRYNSPQDPQDRAVDPAFRGWGRTGTDFGTGLYRFDTIKPGPVVGRHGHRPMAPHVNLWLASRGINIGLATRIYFADEEELNNGDPVLNMIEPAIRRRTLVAHRSNTDGDGVPTYNFDIRLQGEGETVFFDV